MQTIEEPAVITPTTTLMHGYVFDIDQEDERICNIERHYILLRIFFLARKKRITLNAKYGFHFIRINEIDALLLRLSEFLWNSLFSEEFFL